MHKGKIPAVGPVFANCLQFLCLQVIIAKDEDILVVIHALSDQIDLIRLQILPLLLDDRQGN